MYSSSKDCQRKLNASIEQLSPDELVYSFSSNLQYSPVFVVFLVAVRRLRGHTRTTPPHPVRTFFLFRENSPFVSRRLASNCLFSCFTFDKLQV